MDKLTKQLDTSIPIAIALSKIDKMEKITWSSYKTTLNKEMQSKYTSRKYIFDEFRGIKVAEIDYKNKTSI